MSRESVMCAAKRHDFDPLAQTAPHFFTFHDSFLLDSYLIVMFFDALLFLRFPSLRVP